MHALYILHSNSLDRYYVGITTTSVEERLQKHNDATYGIHYTSSAKDWVIKLSIACNTNSESRRLEMYIKRMKSKVFIKKLIESEQEVELLKQKVFGN